MLPPVGAVPLKVTLWRVLPVNCQVTVPPARMVTVAGLKLSPGVVTVAVEGAGGGGGGGGVGVVPPPLPTVTVTAASRVVPPWVIRTVMVEVPAATPVTRPPALTVAFVASEVDHCAAGRPLIT